PKVFSALVTMRRIREYRDTKVEEVLRCLSRYKNKSLRKASKLCGLISNDDRKVEEYPPWEVIELLNSVGLKSV
ncbi:MAG: 16S rRNA (adenine(1518)-N(6)/adenine(1519)-N(6))-dimethyltransferase, partial [Sulfolobales archaeon]